MQGHHARGRTYATGGYVDPSTVIDLGAHRERWSRRAINARRALEAEQADALEYGRLVRAFTVAPKGDEKRAALVAMRAYEAKTGRMPHGQPDYVADGNTAVEVDTAEGTGMGERK